MDMQDQPRYETYEPSSTFKDGLSSRPLPEGTVPRGFLRADAELYTGKRSAAAVAQSASSGRNAQGQQNQDGPSSAGSSAGQGQSGQGGATTGTSSSANTQGTTGAANNSNSGAANTTSMSAAQSGGAKAANNARANASAVDATYPDAVTEFPIPVTASLLDRGEERYQIYCSMCHGMTGYGDGMIVRRGFRKPPSYYEERLRSAPVGHFYDVITNGWGSMPNYAAQIPVQDRWAIIAYIRALQRTVPGAPQANTSSAQRPNNTATGGQR